MNALKEMVTKEPTKDLITELEEGSTSIDSLSEKFPGTIHTLKIVSCWELKETPTQQKTDGRWKRTGPPVIMVNKMSACLFLPNEVRVPIQANHSMMAKLSDEAGSEYHTLKNYLISHVQLAPEAIRRRLVKQECAYVLSEVYPLAAFVYETVCLVKGTPIDTAKYQRILRNELSFLEAFGSMLVDDDMVWMFENSNMSAEWPEYMALCLQRLRTTLSSYTRLAMQYYEPYRNALRPNNFYTSTVLSPRLLIDTTETRPDNKLLVDPQLNSRLFEEDSLDLILDQCRLSTKGLREAMAFAASCSLRFDTRKQSESFQARENVHELQLGSILRRQYLMQTFDDHEAQPLQGHLEDVKERPIDADVLLMDFYAVQGMSPETVIVEYHCYDPSPRFEFNSHNAVSQESIRRQRVDKIRSRMRKLARMLQTASSVPQGLSKATENPALSSLDCLCCIGFLEELESSRFALLFKASPRITVQIGALRSLTFFINQNLASPKGQLTAALDLKFTLALRLCNAVLDVHVCGWVHKSIRSTNVLLVPPPPHSELDVTGQGPNVVLKGFEVSRPVQAASSARANFDPDTNLYRHPARQDAPTDRFRKEHDIYALGVVLLEIGLWETIPSLFRRAIDKARDTGGGFPEPDRVRDKLVTLAHDGLPPRMGTKYAEAVRKCLTGDFGISVDDEQQTTLALELRRQVVDVVEIGSRL